MPDFALVTWGGALATFALGLRHGLDPDHIASVDALAYEAVATGERTRGARWAG